MARHNDIGRWGEDMAVEYMVKQGFAIVERNWRLRHLEIDIVASRDDLMVFVEVKTRTDPDDFGALAIDRRKIAHLCAGAHAYMRQTQLPLRPRYDVICVNGTPDNYTIEHFPDAIRPPLRTYR